MTKGSLIMVEGRLQTRSWQDKAGAMRYITEIVVESVQFGPRRDADPKEDPRRDDQGFAAATRAPRPKRSKSEKAPAQPTQAELVSEIESSGLPEDRDEIDVKDIPL